jgi:hypothetical protein
MLIWKNKDKSKVDRRGKVKGEGTHAGLGLLHQELAGTTVERAQTRSHTRFKFCLRHVSYVIL